MGYIPNKFASSKCRQCGRRNAVGENVWFTRGVRGVLCTACKGQEGANTPGATPRPVPPVAVRSSKDDGRKMIGDRTVREFGSWRAFVDYADSHQISDGGTHLSDSNEMGVKWHGTSSYREASDLARNGWAGIRPTVNALVDKIDSVIAPVLTPAFVNYFDVGGGGVDVGRYLGGEVECMLETRLIETAKPGRVVTILVDGFYSSGVDSDDIVKRGAAIVALVSALEQMQHVTEIWWETSFSGRGNLTYLVKLKSAEDMLDINGLMFAIANPAAHRRINVAAQERPGENVEFSVGKGNSYGRPDGLKMGAYVGAAIELPRLEWGDETVQGEVWIKKVLAKFGLVEEEG